MKQGEYNQKQMKYKSSKVNAIPKKQMKHKSNKANEAVRKQ